MIVYLYECIQYQLSFNIYCFQLPEQIIISHYYEPMVRATLIYPDMYIGEIQALITVRQITHNVISYKNINNFEGKWIEFKV